jgi:arginyl-tRNA synthetase
MHLTTLLQNIKDHIATHIQDEYGLFDVVIELAKTKEATHGDYATNVAMVLTKMAKKPPRDIASGVIASLEQSNLPLTKIELAGPGFINLTFDKTVLQSVISQIHEDAEYGSSPIGKKHKILLEYVSANPTGLLHIGHARGGAYGDSLSRILTKAGYTVHKEFYVNDGGQQIENLALSIQARYFELLGKDFAIPTDGYFGAEIITAATAILDHYGPDLNDLSVFKEEGVKLMLSRLETDLEQYRVTFDQWFRETTLYPSAVEAVVTQLQQSGATYEAEGALWLKTSEYGDEKDRVMITADGRYTYFVPDTAYHKTKFDRGFDELINVWGADHHGTVPRLKASLQLLGYPQDHLTIELLQMVKVYQGGVEVKMSKRSGQAIGLLDLIEEVGVDPIRYFFAARALSTPMELDLDLALRKTSENPVYYAQYAHARIYSVLQKAERAVTPVSTFTTLGDASNELVLLLNEYPLVIEEAAQKRIPHRVANYIQTLATAFHQYYNEETIVTDDATATNERLYFIQAIAAVLKDSLGLLGVVAPERM